MFSRYRLAMMLMGIMFVLSLSQRATAQTWIEITPPGGPTGDELHGLYTTNLVNYDPASNRLIVFLPRSYGFGHAGFDPNLTSDVWILTNANGLGGAPAWIKLATSGAVPAIHFAPSTVYDAATNRLIVYGGGFFHASPALDGVFVLTNANGLGGSAVWSQASVTNPQARLEHSAVYDSPSNRMIAFGGHFAFFGTDQNDTRILSDANGVTSPSAWSTLSTSGGPPAIRGAHSAIYDAANKRMTIFGGSNLLICCGPYVINDYDDVWVLSNASGIGGTPTWTQLSPTGGPPSKRSHHSAVYDTVNNRMIVFGGLQWNQALQDSTFLGDLWQLSNANGTGGTPAWTQITQQGTAPAPSFGHGAAFDSANQRMILFGGVNPTGNNGRVWVLFFNQPPTAICKNVTVSAGPDCTANASIDNGSFDPDGNAITVTQTPSGPYPLGTTTVTLTVTDGNGASAQCTGTVTVVDNTPPSITNVSASPSVLWAPNHKMVDVTIGYTTADNCSGVSCSLSVTSDEPVDGTGDGDTSPDWEVVDAHHVRLRTERAGTGNGRTYTVTITCTDSAGNSASASVTVSVPKDNN